MPNSQSPCRVGAGSDLANGRSRTTLYWGGSVFILIQVLYFWPLTHLFPQLDDGEYGSKWVSLRRALPRGEHGTPREPTVVMFGSSLTGYGFNPASIPDSAE